MSAEVATQRADKPPELARLVKSNRRQVVLFALLTLILTIATVWGGRIWLKDSETLVFAVGDANSEEARFAAKLATVLKNNFSRLRIKIEPEPSDPQFIHTVYGVGYTFDGRSRRTS